MNNLLQRHHLQREEVRGAILSCPPSNGSSSGRRIEASPKHLQSSKPSDSTILVFRIIIISIIIVSIIWGCLVIKIASDINAPVVERQLRPKIPKWRSSGWILRQKLNLIEMQLRPVPLLDVESMDSPVLIITCKRANYLEKTLWNTFQYHPAQQHAASNAQRNGNLKNTRTNHDSAGKAGRILGTPIIVSVDGKNSEVQSVIDAYRQLFELKLGVPLYQIQHPPPGIEKKRQYNPGVDWVDPYKLIAAHLGWALDQTFSGAYSKHQKHYRQIPTPPLPRRVVVLEEDIEIAHDFFSLMNATADLLDSDDTLLAVSGFNDNGYEQLVADPKRLVRSDFFPGLGWMMSRTVWDGPASHPDTGLNRNWAPNGFWDDWLRESDIRRGRQIIRPEISRSFHFGNVDGASTGNKVNEKLNKIKLEENSIHWEDLDLSHLAASSFADNYWNRVSRAKSVKNVDDAKRYVADGDVRLVYYSFYQFGILASQFEIMQDEKAGVPRTGYEGIVEIRYGRGNFVIFLTPKYVDEIHKPEHFGMRAWMKSSKESLMRDLGIQNIHSEVKPDLKT